MNIESSILKLKNLVLSTYDFENYKDNVQVLNVYYLYLINNKNYSTEDKKTFLKTFLETNNDYLVDWLNNFFLESILKLKERNKSLVNNDYFMFKYLSNKEIIKMIFIVNSNNVFFFWQESKEYLFLFLKEEDQSTFFEKMSIFMNIYQDIHNEKININSFEEFLNIKKNMIENDDITISYMTNDYFFIKENEKIKVSNKFKNFIFLFFNIKIDDTDLNLDLDNIEDIKNNIKKMIIYDYL